MCRLLLGRSGTQSCPPTQGGAQFGSPRFQPRVLTVVRNAVKSRLIRSFNKAQLFALQHEPAACASEHRLPLKEHGQTGYSDVNIWQIIF